MKLKLRINKQMINLIMLASILITCLVSAIVIHNTYKNVVLLKYENKDIVIGKAYNRNFLGFYYRSFEAQDHPSVPFTSKDMSYSYNDSINSNRPLLVKSFRWDKISFYSPIYILRKKKLKEHNTYISTNINQEIKKDCSH